MMNAVSAILFDVVHHKSPFTFLSQFIDSNFMASYTYRYIIKLVLLHSILSKKNDFTEQTTVLVCLGYDEFNQPTVARSISVHWFLTRHTFMQEINQCS